MQPSHNSSRGHALRNQWGTRLLVGFACLSFTACAQAPLTMFEPSVPNRQSMATLMLEDSAMSFEKVSGTPLSEKTLHHADVSTSVRTLNVSPGTYQVTLAYEHLTQPRCWEDGTATHCWKVRDRGWWLPGATLIPGIIAWEPEAGKTYTVKRSGSYWSMAEKPSWNPIISLVTTR